MALFVAFGGPLFISGVSLVFLLVHILRYAEFLQCSWFGFRRVLGSALPEVCNRPGSSRGPRGRWQWRSLRSLALAFLGTQYISCCPLCPVQ